ncbi:MAG TPA: polynucleotide adenylyltransferase PcnB [Rhodanobacteraceae bacterium]|nr:polynucleotide adenylyltransferase PcnB [Rhodanobacteraceae bacterium]
MNHSQDREPTPQLRIYSRDEHAISRKHISGPALKVLYRLNEAGHTACLVGGAVRDLLLGIAPKDYDVATDATPEEVKRLFRNCRLIGRRFRLAHVVFGREIIEVATFRGTGAGADDDGAVDRHIVDGRILRDNVWGSIEEDALRRDFRVNALYYDISDFSVRDYAGGVEDLHDRVLRLIGDPEQRYREDPVRMLRAARLAAKLDFRIADETAAPFAHLGPLLAEAAPARLFDESLKMFLSGHGLASMRVLRYHGLLQHLFPVTARALARDDDALEALVDGGLISTDRRVAEGKSVTPAFLFAVLLWGEVRHAAAELVAAGEDEPSAWERAAARTVAEQAARVSIPRRFVYTMEEIWALQRRVVDRSRKGTLRLLAHPRFRAAYDFLLLRAAESPEVAELGQWWTEAQELPHDELAERLQAMPESPQAEQAISPPRKRRRRRGRRGGRARHAGERPAGEGE